MTSSLRYVPVDLIIHTLAEKLKEGTEEWHNDLSLALYACIDLDALAEEWDASLAYQSAEWILRRINGGPPEPSMASTAATRVTEIAVAKRLATRACCLGVTQDAEDLAAARSLWRAATRIVGVQDSAEDAGFVRRLLKACAEEASPLAGQSATEHPAEQAGVIGAALRKAAVWKSMSQVRREALHLLGWDGTEGLVGWALCIRKALCMEPHDQRSIEGAACDLRVNACSTCRDERAAALAERDAHAKTITKVRDIADAALRTTKGATSFTLPDIIDEMRLQLESERKVVAKMTAERDHLLAERDALAKRFGDALRVFTGDTITPSPTNPAPVHESKLDVSQLRTLHDLDLGALAHTAGVDGETLTDEALRALCKAFTTDEDNLCHKAREALHAVDANWTESCRIVSARGAKIRAALPTEVVMPAPVAKRRVLASADEAPRGSLVRSPDTMALRLPDGTGWHGALDGDGEAMEVNEVGWGWSMHGLGSPVEVIAEGLTDAECRTLSGMSGPDAVAWCEARAAKPAPSQPT